MTGAGDAIPILAGGRLTGRIGGTGLCLMTIQTGPFVKKFGATALAGWGAGYAVLRELGPILIGLMFSGRVGANNTAELATMTVTEQLGDEQLLAVRLGDSEIRIAGVDPDLSLPTGAQIEAAIATDHLHFFGELEQRE